MILLIFWGAYWLVLAPTWEGVSYQKNYTGHGLHRGGTFSLASGKGGFHPLWNPPASGGGFETVVRWPLQSLPTVGEDQQLFVVRVSEVKLVTNWCAGLLMLGLVFGGIQKANAPAPPDWVVLAGWNCALALSVAFLALFILGLASMGYAWTPPIVLGTLLSAVGIGLGLGWSQCVKTGPGAISKVPAIADGEVSVSPPSLVGKEATLEHATAIGQPADVATSSAEPLPPSRADTGASPGTPATPDAMDPDVAVPPEDTSGRFSFGTFVAACFVMVLVAWIAVDLAAPYRGPHSEHVTTLGTRPYVRDQWPVNRALAMGIALAALLIAKIAWRPGWRSFAAGILVSGLLLALLALFLHS